MKTGRILLGLLLLTGAVGVLVTGNILYSRFLYLGAALIFVSWAWTRRVLAGLTFDRRARVERANVGDVFEEKFEFSNQGPFPAPWIEVSNQAPIPFAAGSRLFTAVRSRDKQSYLARTWLTRRGAYPLGATRLSTGDPFGLFNSSREFPAQQTLVVLPVIFPVSSFLFPPGLLPGGRVIRRKSADITPHAAGVREYVPGDAVKRIHWPTSIRRGHLMVKEFEQDPQAEIWLLLDLQHGVHHSLAHEPERPPLEIEALVFRKRPKFKLPPSSLEYAVSITASLAHYFVAQRRAVGFVSAGQILAVHAAENSQRQEARILETLAFVEDNGRLSIAALAAVQASQMPQGSSAVLVTPSTRPDLLHAVDDLQRRYLRPIVVLLDPQTFGGPRGTEKLAQALEQRRVPVVVIPCGADLTQALSIVPSTLSPKKEMPSWKTSVSSPSI